MMETPIYDFVKAYAAATDVSRLHMPGHKGQSFLGCEPMDITEIHGADALYEAEGIIRRSEEQAASLFGAERTLYSTEGSSQCLRAMLYLALACRPQGTQPTVLAARNVHRAFLSAAALLDIDPVWLWPEEDGLTPLSCPVTPEGLERALQAMKAPPAAVYVTSPDYLGYMLDVAGLAKVCHAHGTLLLVDNAHGAYLRFLDPSLHPMTAGADLCCDSAHKTLAVLTGGAYLHLNFCLPSTFAERAKSAMALFGSTSPSYLTLASLDRCNADLAGGYARWLAGTVAEVDALKDELRRQGWSVRGDEPLKLTLCAARVGLTGTELAARLHEQKIECEFADSEYIVFLFSPEILRRDYERLAAALGQAPERVDVPPWPRLRPRKICTPRQALFSRQETVPLGEAAGQICGAPTAACPPSVPIVAPGEEIDKTAVEVLKRCGVQNITVAR